MNKNKIVFSVLIAVLLILSGCMSLWESEAAKYDAKYGTSQNEDNAVSEEKEIEDANRLIDAVKNNDTAGIEELIAVGVNLNAQGKFGGTALQTAASSGMIDMAAFLLDKGAGLNFVSKYGGTPLSYSTYSTLEMTQFLLDKGADLYTRDGVGRTILHDFAASGNIDGVIFAMDKGMDLELTDDLKATPLIVAAGEGRVEMVEFLVEHGANINALNKFGETVLIHAAYEGQTSVVELCLQYGLDINAKASLNRSALYWAAYHGHLETCKYLVSHGADPSMIGDGQTPAEAARMNDFPDVAAYLESVM